MKLSHDQIVEKAMGLVRPKAELQTNSIPSVYATFSNYEIHQALQNNAMVSSTKASLTNHRDWIRFTKDMYFGKQLKYLDKNEAEQIGRFTGRRGKQTIPLTAAFINIMTGIYENPVTRIPTKLAEDEVSKNFQTWCKDSCLDSKQLTSERLLCGLGNGAIKLSYDEVFNKINYQWITPDNLRVVTDPEDKNKILAAIVTMESDVVGEDAYSTIYTEEEIIPMKNGEPIDVENDLPPGPSGKGYKNPYRIIINGVERGIIPLIMCKYNPNDNDSWFCEGEGFQIADANATINNLMCGLGNQMYYQAFTMLKFINVDPKTMSVGPGSGFKINADNGLTGDIEGVRLDSHAMEFLQVIADIINFQLKAHRIPESALHAEANVQSGVAIVASSAPMQEMRKESQMRWTPIEKELFWKWCVISAYHNGESAPDYDQLDIYIEYQDTETNFLPDKQIEIDKLQMSMGLISIVDVVLREKGDLFCHIEDPEEKEKAVMEYIKKNFEMNKEVMTQVDPEKEAKLRELSEQMVNPKQETAKEVKDENIAD